MPVLLEHVLEIPRLNHPWCELLCDSYVVDALLLGFVTAESLYSHLAHEAETDGQVIVVFFFLRLGKLVVSEGEEILAHAELGGDVRQVSEGPARVALELR